MRFNIRAKVITAVSLSLIVILGLTIFLVVTRQANQLRDNLNQQSKSFASLATPRIGNTFLLYKDSGSIRITQQVDKFLDLDPDVTAIRIVSVDGKQLYNSRDSASQPVKPALAASFIQRTIMNDAGYVNQVIQPFFEDSGAHRYSVVYEISTRRVQQTVNDDIRLIVYVGAVILALSIAGTSWLLNTLFIRPLRAVSQSANQISNGDLSQQITSGRADEIGDLAVSVNKMAENLKADIVKLRALDKLKSEFMMIASHNLRTPLTVMRGYMDMAEDAQTIQELKSIVDGVQESVTRLHLLSEDLLTISSLESGGEQMQKMPTGAKSFLGAVVGEFKLLAEKKQLNWRYIDHLPDDLKIDISQSNMRSALGNLIDNAIKFTKEHGTVRILAKTENDKLVFTVSDNGIGVRQEEIPRLFTKFHRGTSTLTYDYEGAGIGLYLTKLIVGEHGGQITVESQPGQGSTFTVYLPLTQPVPAARPPAS